jgi:hypothetical protein
MIPKMKNTKKHSRRTLPNMGSVSNNNITRILIPAFHHEDSQQKERKKVSRARKIRVVDFISSTIHVVNDVL